MAIGTLFGSNPESSGLYGIATGTGNNPTVINQTYFEWFIFITSSGTPATPTGGSWDFNTNTGTAPAGWSNFISGVPLNSLWFSVAFVDSRNPTVITWSTPGLISSQSVYATAYANVFTGNGSTVAWTLSNDPVVVNNTDVSINGVTQVPTTDYTISGTTLTTTTAAPLNAIILVKYRQALPLSYYGAASNVQFTPVGALTATNVQAAITEVVTDLALSSGSSTVGFLQAGTSAVPTTVQAKLRESVSVLDFGADPTGVANSTAAIQAAIDSVTRGVVQIPAGTYKCNTTLTLNVSKCRVEGMFAKLDFTGLGTSSTAIAITGTADATSPYYQAGTVLSGLIIQGPSNVTGTSTGLYFNSAAEPGASHIKVEGVVVYNFKHGGQIGNNAYIITFDNCDLHTNGIGFLAPQGTPYPPGLSNSGERLSFVNSTIYNNLIYGLDLEWEGCTTKLVNTSVDYNLGSQILLTKGRLDIEASHIEFNGFRAIQVPAGNTIDATVTISGTEIIQAASSGATPLIDFSGQGQITIVGGEITKNASTTNHINASANCSLAINGTKGPTKATVAIASGCAYSIFSPTYNSGTLTSVNLNSRVGTNADGNVYYASASNIVACAVNGTWVDIGTGVLGGLFVFRDASLGGVSYAPADSATVSPTLAGNIANFEMRYNSGMQIRVTAGAPRNIRYGLFCVNTS
jgi:hypothetical protein